ncbi:FtsQ-type POTRA domain-containing protein [uncultured Megasphaera sp.]|uniref:cell division protein FtsQ/DivIB n=1 Tax=uncultured Megasphaera sp. TaxID=165188 RepID=UPI0028062BE5|nr:FtsQ-type POTRA domain-containing protein [uncultured Megasphaera sp.]
MLPNDTHDVFVPPRLENDPLNEPDRQAQAAKKAALRRRKARQAARLKKKRARQKQIWARRRRIACLLTVVGVFVLWLFLRLAPVPFGTIIVDGNEKMSFEDVYRACGAYSYVNVIQLSTDDVEERLKKDLRIADATVTREFPATIHVTMTERKPAAYVDKTGKVIELGPQIKGVSLPIMTGKKVDNLLLGDTVTDPTLHAAMVYLQSLPPDIMQNIAEINVGNPESIVAYTTDSIPIHLGSGDEPAERAKLTETLLAEVQENHLAVQYIDTDVRSPLVKTK